MHNMSLRLIRVTNLPTLCEMAVIPGEIYANRSAIVDVQLGAIYDITDEFMCGRDATHLIHDRHVYTLHAHYNFFSLTCDGVTIASVDVPHYAFYQYGLIFHNSTANPLRIYYKTLTTLFELEIVPK